MRKLMSMLTLGMVVGTSSLFANSISIGEKLTKFNNNNLNLKYGAEFNIKYKNNLNETSKFKLDLSTAIYDRNNVSSIKKNEETGILSTKLNNKLDFYLGFKRSSVKIDKIQNKYSYIMGLNIKRGDCKANINYIYTPNIENNAGLNQANFVVRKKITPNITFSNALTIQRFTKKETNFDKKNFLSDIFKLKYDYSSIFNFNLTGKIGSGLYKVNPYTFNMNILPIKEKYGMGIDTNIHITKNVNFNVGFNYQRNSDSKKDFSSYDIIASLGFKF